MLTWFLYYNHKFTERNVLKRWHYNYILLGTLFSVTVGSSAVEIPPQITSTDSCLASLCTKQNNFLHPLLCGDVYEKTLLHTKYFEMLFKCWRSSELFGEVWFRKLFLIQALQHVLVFVASTGLTIVGAKGPEIFLFVAFYSLKLCFFQK